MKILFVGGDKRYKQMILDLAEQGYEVSLLGFENLETDTEKIKLNNLNISMYDTIIFPVSGVYDDYTIKSEYNNEKIELPIRFLGNSKKGCLIFTGIMTERLSELLKIVKQEAYILMKKDDIVKYNSIITCEGIISDLIENTDIAIYESNIMVIGYGNVGRRLVSLLEDIGAKTTVIVKEEKDFKELKEKEINVFFSKDIKKCLDYQDAIINTAPEKVLTSSRLQCVNNEAYVLDIASFPGGVDFKSAEKLGITNKHYFGIPSSTAPKSAGKILSKKIDEIIKENKNG